MPCTFEHLHCAQPFIVEFSQNACGCSMKVWERGDFGKAWRREREIWSRPWNVQNLLEPETQKTGTANKAFSFFVSLQIWKADRKYARSSCTSRSTHGAVGAVLTGTHAQKEKHALLHTFRVSLLAWNIFFVCESCLDDCENNSASIKICARTGEGHPILAHAY